MEDAAFQDSLLLSPSVLGWHVLACASDRFLVLILSCALGGLNLGEKISLNLHNFNFATLFFCLFVLLQDLALERRQIRESILKISSEHQKNSVICSEGWRRGRKA